jgi:hypothetical protein
MMEEGFRPRGGLGIIKCDLLHIEFFHEDKFDESFERLIAEINFIEKKLGIKSGKLHFFPINSYIVLLDVVSIPPVGVSTSSLTTLTTMTSSSGNDVNFRSEFNAIISEHITATNESSLRRENLNEEEFRRSLDKFIQEFSPETLQSFQNNQSNDVDNSQKQENDNDRLIQHLVEEQNRFAEFVRIQQEKNDFNEQHLLDNDERLAAFKRFEKKQEEHNAYMPRRHFIQNEELKSLVFDQQRDCASLRLEFSRRQQEQERNNRILEQLLQQVQQLTDLVVTQQQQHAQQLTELHTTQQQQHQENRFNFDIFNKLCQTIILLWILIILLQHQ